MRDKSELMALAKIIANKEKEISPFSLDYGQRTVLETLRWAIDEHTDFPAEVQEIVNPRIKRLKCHHCGADNLETSLTDYNGYAEPGHGEGKGIWIFYSCQKCGSDGYVNFYGKEEGLHPTLTIEEPFTQPKDAVFKKQAEGRLHRLPLSPGKEENQNAS
jgi:hypothetical protein